MAFFRRKKKRSLVIGLDGVPHSLLVKLADEGVMPAVGKLMSLGHTTRMKVTLPEISAVSWPSFMTGTNPGTHGIFGFVDFKPGTYDLKFPNFGDLKVPAFWDDLGKKGQTVVLNQPSTYPARPIPGVLVSGFVALTLRKAVQPMRYIRDLKEIGYEIDIDTGKAREDHEYCLQALTSTLEGRRRAVDLFWDELNWDVFEVVVTGTDRLHHYLWEALEDPDHEHHEAFLDYYRRVDLFLAELVERFQRSSGRNGEGEGLFLLSDHGFCGIQQEVRLNRWLMDHGYLSFETASPESLAQMHPESRAFALDPNRIYLHRKGRFPNGSVQKQDSVTILEEIRAGLSEVTDQGQPVFEGCFLRDEVYSGPETVWGPDMIALGNHGYDIKGTLKETELFGRTNLTGMHTWDDAFLWSLEAPPEGIDITGVSSLITESLA